MALRSGAGGRVSIGTVMAPAVEAVFEALKHVRPRQPQLRISVSMRPATISSAACSASRYDWDSRARPTGPATEDLDYVEGRAEDCCLLVRRGHPLSGRGPIAPPSSRIRTGCCRPTGSLLRRNVEAMFRRNGLPPPERVLDTRSTLMTLVMVSKTDAVAAVAEPVARLLAKSAGGFEILTSGPGLGGALRPHPHARAQALAGGGFRLRGGQDPARRLKTHLPQRHHGFVTQGRASARRGRG